MIVRISYIELCVYRNRRGSLNIGHRCTGAEGNLGTIITNQCHRQVCVYRSACIQAITDNKPQSASVITGFSITYTKAKHANKPSPVSSSKICCIGVFHTSFASNNHVFINSKAAHIWRMEHIEGAIIRIVREITTAIFL